MRIAVVGAGVSGLGAAYLLARHHDVHVFEADDRPGGHANTVTHVNDAGVAVPVDTGFLVHSRENYPNLIRLFDELDIETRPTTMSFSVSCARCGIEYAGARPWAQLRTFASPALVRLSREVLRFCRTAEAEVRDDQTLDDFVRDGRYSQSFRNHFLLPLASALWSASATETRGFPATYVIGFFAHHGMLRLRRFTWRTVVGGSRVYVDRLVARLPNGVRCATPVRSVVRHDDHVELTSDDGTERFDHVVLACHTDQALRLLADPTPDESRLLSAIPYTRNPTVLHRDVKHMPRRRGAWAAWNYRTQDCQNPDPTVTVTYDISLLQGLPGPERYLVTLNRDMPIDPDLVIRRIDYSHPRFTFPAMRAQREIPTINGARRTWYCGAWRAFGFHEDGLRSAVEVAEALGGGWR